MSTVKLPVTNGPMTLVDSDIAKKLEGKSLCYTPKKYVLLSKKGITISLHRFVTNDVKGLVVDHINGNVFDNRRSNLRVCTRSENALNRRKESKAQSGYRLVYKNQKASTYRLCYKIKGKKNYLCSFRSRHIAGIFADQVLVTIVGHFVKKNFPEKITLDLLANFLKNTNGRIFRVVFSRRSDGLQREMLCRTGVKAHQTGGTILFDPISRNLFSVYDVQKKAYRFIPLENVICIRFAKTNYRVVA